MALPVFCLKLTKRGNLRIIAIAGVAYSED